MTSKEALKTLNKYRNSHYNSVNKEERELANALNVMLPEYVKLVERNTPMKVIMIDFNAYCDNCGNHISKIITQTYCDECGQRLDWSDDE